MRHTVTREDIVYDPPKTYDHAFAILRWDTFLYDEQQAMNIGGCPLPAMFTIKKVMWDQGKAEAEVERLNKLNEGKAKYYLHITRVERK